jgi:hypothetical protein
MRRGQRFESTRRLSRFGLNKPNSGVRGRAEWWARNFLHHSYITEGMGRVGFVSARYLDCRRLSTSWTLWTLTPGETLRCSFTCSGISDCPGGCATRMASTTSRLTPTTATKTFFDDYTKLYLFLQERRRVLRSFHPQDLVRDASIE